MALRLGLTQKKIKQLVKDSERYNRLYEYITEKRVLYACELIKANPQWSMEAVSKDSGFVSRTTFQTEFKKRIGVTPAQYRANSQYDVVRVK
jgi:AraC-like DNA-binding protein